MPYSTVQYTGNGLTTQFSVPFPFISRDHVEVTVDGISKTFSWISDGLISIVPAPASGKLVTVLRNSSRTQRLVDFQDATTLTEQDLDLANTQAIYISQEAFDASDVASVTSEVTSLRDAAGVYAANAATSAAEALVYKNNAASSADSAGFFSQLAADNAASAEALNRVLKAGDTMTGVLKVELAGGGTYGTSRFFAWQDQAGRTDYKTWSWYAWTPSHITWPDFDGAVSFGPCLDDYTPTLSMMDFFNGPIKRRIQINGFTQLWASWNSPQDQTVDFWYPRAEHEFLNLQYGLDLLPGSAYAAGISGDFSNTVTSKRSMFWERGSGTFTSVGAACNAGGTFSEWAAYGDVDLDNSPVVRMRATVTGNAEIYAGKTGAAAYPPLLFYTSALERMRIEAGGNVLINANLKFPNASSRILTKGTASPVGERTMFQCHETNQNTVLGAIPNGTATLAAIQVYNNSDLTAACSYVDIRSGASIHSIYSGSANSGTVLPLQVSVGGHLHRFETSGCLNFCDATDPGFGGSWRGLNMKGGSVTDGSYVRLSNSDATAVFDFLVGSNFNATMRTISAIPIIFQTNTVERMRIAGDGKVGIGITPTCAFHVSAPDGAGPMFLFAGTTKGLRMFTTANYSFLEGVDQTGAGSYQPLVIGGSNVSFQLSGTEKVRIDGQGSLCSYTSGYYSVLNQSTSTTTHTIDFTQRQYYKLTMGHNIATLTLTAPERACVVQLEIVQDATGSRTMAWPASLKWPASYAAGDKTISTAANARDLLVLRWNGTDYVANLLKGIA
jgi:hypothetical protein